MKAESLRLASQILADAETELRKEGRELAKCVMLPASARPLPDLTAILASHALIHTAEGELFREAIAQACDSDLPSPSDGLAIFAISSSASLVRRDKFPLKSSKGMVNPNWNCRHASGR